MIRDLGTSNTIEFKNTPWILTEECQKAFDEMKQLIATETLLVYPDFNEEFVIHTDASHKQLGAVISQNGKPIAFFSRKLNPAQTRYTTTERELLAIVETLKEFKNILLGHKVKIYTDHKNLTWKNFNTDRVMRWRLILEEFGPELIYLKGETNVVADALSRLGTTDTLEPDESTPLPYTAECYNFHKTSNELYPLSFAHLGKAQQADNDLLEDLRTNPTYALRSFRGGDTIIKLICKNGKIVVPKSLQVRIVEWYHTVLCHPGMTRTEESIRQHFTWQNLQRDVREYCQKCHTCQITKRDTKNYGHLPEKKLNANLGKYYV